MFFILTVIFLTAAAGACLTYLIEENAPFWARLSVGAVIGQILLGGVGFIAAKFIGLTTAGVWLSAVLASTPLLLLINKNFRANFQREASENLRRAGEFFSTGTASNFATFAAYSLLFVLLWFFFERAMLVSKNGIAVGASNNLGDLPYHLGAIFSFTEAENFYPQNPSFAGAKFTYPFLVDFIAAQFSVFNKAAADAMFWQNFALCFALVGTLFYFASVITQSRFVARVTPFLVLFSGGFGFVMLRSDWAADTQGLWHLLMNLPKDYSIQPETDGLFRWGNSLMTLFITQRSFLLGLPLAVYAFTQFWKILSGETRLDSTAANNPTAANNIDETSADIDRTRQPSTLDFGFPLQDFLLGLLVGSLVIVHAHSLAVVLLVGGFLGSASLKKWRRWAGFFAGAFVSSAPIYFWLTRGGATKVGKFVDWHFGWVSGKYNVVWYWLVNTGFLFPLLVVALIWLVQNAFDNTENDAEMIFDQRRSRLLLIFYAPFAFLFILPNLVKLAPWEWDNIKVLFYWFIASVPLTAWVLAVLRRKNIVAAILVGALLIGLCLAGFLDVWRTATRNIDYNAFEADSVKLGEKMREITPPKAIILNAHTYNSAAVLSGRASFMRYSAHLESHGIDYAQREAETRRIYEGAADALELLRKNKIDYIIVSPREYETLTVNEDFISRFPLIAQFGEYRLYAARSAENDR